jgi:hypothetical protein
VTIGYEGKRLKKVENYANLEERNSGILRWDGSS